MDTVTALVDDSDGPQSLQELTHFFLLFRAMTAVARHFDQLSMQDLLAERDQVGTMLHDYFSSSEIRGPVSDFFFTSLGPDEPQIVSIVKQSPLEFVLAGSIPLLIFALVVSGGELTYDAGKLRVKLPPLGTGIKKLIEAFAVEDRSKTAREKALHTAKETLKERTRKPIPAATTTAHPKTQAAVTIESLIGKVAAPKAPPAQSGSAEAGA